MNRHKPAIGRRAALRLLLSLFAIAASCWLAGCAQIASVRETAPSLPPSTAEGDAALERARTQALTGWRILPQRLASSLTASTAAARTSLAALRRLPRDRASGALAIYNFSVARIVEAALQSGTEPWRRAVRVRSPQGEFRLRMRSNSEWAWLPGTDRLRATDRLVIGGTGFPQRNRIEGIGAPFVSSGEGRREPWMPEKHYYSVTALARFSGSDCAIQVADPNATPLVDLAGAARPVASDMSAAMALRIVEQNPQRLGLGLLLRADRFADTNRLMMVSPYRSDRIPIIVVHGLNSSPVTWIALFNSVDTDPILRGRYQFWVFRYSTGYPFPIAATYLRDEIASIYRAHPETPPAILIGHSMGGLVARLVVSDSRGSFYSQEVFGKPFSQVQVDPPEREQIRKALFFTASPHVSEAIFIATPHRGARMASGGFGRLIAALIRLPLRLMLAGPKLIAQIAASPDENVIRRFPNGIDTLRPEARLVKALAKLPIKVPYYSIIGDRGRGDSPHSSDGVVEYGSSHLDGAVSEKIVPSAHDAHASPEGIAEVKRILAQYAKEH